MADEKISDLPAATTVADADLATVVQSGTNKKSALSVIKTYLTTAFNAIYVPLTRTLTIGGSAKTLSADRSWTTSDILDSAGSAQGDILYRGASNWTVLAPGTDGNVLTTHSTSSNPTWAAPSSGNAPSNAHYLTSQSESGLSNEVNLGALTTGILKHSVSGSISTPATATAGTDYTDNAFKTISVSGQSDIVADSASDTLTVAAGSNVTITTNAGTDTLPIAASAPGTGTVTTTGSPATGNLTKFSGSTSITNADLTGDVTTSGTVAATIANAAVTYAKIQNVSASSKLIGSSDSGSGAPPSEITLGTNLSMSGSTLNAAGGGSGTTSQVTGSNFTMTAVGTATDITGLTFAAAANKLYEVDVLLRMQNSNTQAHHWGIQYSAGGATGSFTYTTGTNSTATSVAINVLGTPSAPNTCQAATTDIMVWVKGFVVTGGSTGNITMQAVRDGAGTTTIYIGSRMTVTLLA